MPALNHCAAKHTCSDFSRIQAWRTCGTFTLKRPCGRSAQASMCCNVPRRWGATSRRSPYKAWPKEKASSPVRLIRARIANFVSFREMLRAMAPLETGSGNLIVAERDKPAMDQVHAAFLWKERRMVSVTWPKYCSEPVCLWYKFSENVLL